MFNLKVSLAKVVKGLMGDSVLRNEKQKNGYHERSSANHRQPNPPRRRTRSVNCYPRCSYFWPCRKCTALDSLLSKNHQGSVRKSLLILRRWADMRSDGVKLRSMGVRFFILLILAPMFAVLGIVPAHADTLPPSLPGTIISQTGDASYSTATKFDCPSNAVVISDCRMMLEFSGAGYDDVIKKGVDSNSAAPVHVFAAVALDYVWVDSGTSYRRTLLQMVPVVNDKTSGKIFAAVDLTKFYFNDFSSPSGPYAWGFDGFGQNGGGGSDGWDATWQTNMGPLAGQSGHEGPCAGDSEAALTGGSALYQKNGNQSAMACLHLGSAYATPSAGWWGQPFNASNAAASFKGLEVNLFKSPKLSSPSYDTGLYNIMIGSDNESGLVNQWGYPRAGFAFPNSDVQPIAPSGCSVPFGIGSPDLASQFGFFVPTGPPLVGSVLGPGHTRDRYDKNGVSGQTVFQFLSGSPSSSSSCYLSNPSVYNTAPSSTYLGNPANVVASTTFDKMVSSAVAVVPGELPPPPPPRPDFATCVSIDPLNFKVDWPCIIDSLFTASPDANKGMQDSINTLFSKFPFSFLGQFWKQMDAIFNPKPGACVPATMDLLGAKITMVPCDQKFSDSFRPITTWASDLLIIFYGGTWMYRKFLPSLPSDKD